MDITYLKESIKENEIQQKKDKKQNYLSDSLLQVVEAFMKKNNFKTRSLKRSKGVGYSGTEIRSIFLSVKPLCLAKRIISFDNSFS